MAEVVRDEYDTGAPLRPVPLYAQTGDDRYGNAEKMIIKGVDVLPHGLINNVAEKFGPSGEILADYVRWLVGRIRDLAPSPDYRPRLHFDLYGCAGLAFSGDIDAVAALPGRARQIAQPYDLAIEHPIDAGSREAQIATFRSLRDALTARGSGVRIVVDEWCNTLDDVRAFVAAGAADVIHVKTPDLGSIGNTRRGAAAGPRRRARGLLRRHLQRDRPVGAGQRAPGDGLRGHPGAGQAGHGRGRGTDDRRQRDGPHRRPGASERGSAARERTWNFRP